MSKIIGWIAIVVSIFALLPSIVPGAFSLFGLMLSVVAMVLSLFSVKRNGQRYVKATALTVAANVFVVNDALRIWEPLPMPLLIRLGLYGLMLAVLLICITIAYKLGRYEK
jgi:hypothetical protein